MSLSPDNSTSITHTVTNPLVDPVYVNDATVTVTIYVGEESGGVELSGESWPVVLPYVSGSDGEYSKSFEPFGSLVIGQMYSVVIKAEGADGLDSKCTTRIKATKRIC